MTFNETQLPLTHGSSSWKMTKVDATLFLSMRNNSSQSPVIALAYLLDLVQLLPLDNLSNLVVVVLELLTSVNVNCIRI